MYQDEKVDENLLESPKTIEPFNIISQYSIKAKEEDQMTDGTCQLTPITKIEVIKK